MKRILSGLGNLALSLATMTFIAAASLFVVGSFLVTWPVLRLSPRDRRVRAAMDLVTASMAAAQVFAPRSLQPGDADDTPAP